MSKFDNTFIQFERLLKMTPASMKSLSLCIGTEMNLGIQILFPNIVLCPFMKWNYSIT